MRNLLSVFLPTRCTFCGDILSGSGDICPDCHKVLPTVPEKRCKKCGMPFTTPYSLPICLDCRTDKYVFKKVYAPFLYQGVVRNGVLRFKFHEKRSAARPLAVYLKDFMEKEGMPPIDLISSVPIDHTRFLERNYNQCELLAEELAKLLNVPYVPLLMKKDGVKRQSSLSKSARKKNVRGAFSLLGKKDINEKCILLVDDIYTTGATVGECSRILRRGGAKEVNIAVVALAHQSEFYGRKN